MIPPEEWERIGKKASKIYTSLELEIIEEIAERIENVGYANTVVMNDIIVAEQMGLLYDEIIMLVAKYNHTSENKIRAIFEDTAIKSIRYDDNIYKMQGLKPIPLKQSKTMWQFLEATARNTNYTLENLTKTTAKTSQILFYNKLQQAYLEVSTGVKSYEQSISDIVKELGGKNVKVEYPSGRKMNLSDAVRMNVLTSCNQMCGELQLMRAEEMGCDLMEITAHSGARPEHQEWQGKIVSLSGKKGYLSLKDIGYGEITGFKGVNCRHDWLPYYKGTTKTYTKKELEELKK